jgi:hypothetical protein
VDCDEIELDNDRDRPAGAPVLYGPLALGLETGFSLKVRSVHLNTP